MLDDFFRVSVSYSRVSLSLSYEPLFFSLRSNIVMVTTIGSRLCHTLHHYSFFRLHLVLEIRLTVSNYSVTTFLWQNAINSKPSYEDMTINPPPTAL